MKRFTNILNYFGLTVAFAAFMVVAVQVKWDLTFNRAFPDHERIYRLEGAVGKGEYWGHTCQPIINLIEGLEGVEQSGTLSWEGFLNWTTSDAPDALRTSLLCNSVSRAYFDVVGLEILEGDVSDFDSLRNVVAISDKAAETLFPGESAVGKRIYMHDDGHSMPMTVKTVFRAMPDNSWPRHDVYSNMTGTSDDWNEWSFTCLMKLTPDACPDSVCWALARKIEAMGVQLIAEETVCPFQTTRLDRLHFEDRVISDTVPKANRSTLITLVTTAIVLLLIAVINFFNISMAGAPMLIRGLNTRMILGTPRRSLVLRQLLRTALLAMLAVASAVGLVYLLGQSSFAKLVSGSLLPQDNGSLIALLLLVAMGVSLLGGIYPALYSTSFQPALVLKGNFALSGRGRRLRNMLVGTQFVISMVLVVFAIYVQVQTDFMRSHDMGFCSEQIYYSLLPHSAAEKQETLTENLMKRPEIEDVTFANARIASRNGIAMTWGRMFEQTKINYTCLPVAINFCNFFGIKVEEGRDFREGDLQDEHGCYIFNRAAADRWDMKAGDKLDGHNGMTNIVGIVSDFNFKSLQYAVEPAALYCFGSTPWRPLYHCYFRVAQGITLEQATAILLEECQRLDGTVRADDVQVEFLDESLGRMYAKEEQLGTLILAACIISVLISLIGVLGLIHYETQYRRREIGIRRVLGTSICEILLMLNRTYVCICLLCFLVAVPIAVTVIRRWLQGYAYQTPFQVWPFASTLAAVLLIVCAAVMLQSLRTAMSNPVNSIKQE